MDWKVNLPQQLEAATALVRQGQLARATQAIQDALQGKNIAPAAPGAWTAPVTTPAAAPQRSKRAQQARWSAPLDADVQDAVVLDRPVPSPRSAPAAPAAKAKAPAPRMKPQRTEAPGSFTRMALAHGGMQRHYWLSVPPGAKAGTDMPLVVMLHGCTQNPQDFATGTRMNAAAAPANALVLYPAQAPSANHNGCWNWFLPEHQQRDQGEPDLLLAMLRYVRERHPVDAKRVYAAGLSAGGAMAALLGREYPDVFAAIGVHSGLQAGAAQNMMAALSAMKTGAKLSAPVQNPARAEPAPALIVFHGDADGTVNAKNGEQLVQATLNTLHGGPATAQRHTQQGRSPAGQPFTQTVYSAGHTVVAEHWLLHGAGHAWSGGHPGGSHTDARGVDATQEMLRFFLEHQHTR